MRRPAAVLLTALAVAPGVRAQSDPRARIFVDRGCTECHAITALRVKASRDVAPDLTYAYGDVRRRYGLTLEAFLADPTGVMRMMVASHLRLTLADRDSMVRILRALYAERTADSEVGVPTLPRTPACPP